MGSSVIPFHKEKPNSPPDDLVGRVQTLSMADSLNVHITEHCRDRMLEREIAMRSVLEVLRHGRSVGPPKLDEECGDWRIEMRRKVAGQRVHVVVAVSADHLECITTWVAGTHHRREGNA